MQYGLELPNGGACGDPRVLAEMAALAEEAGWDGVFIEDYITHHSGRDSPTCDPWVALAAMALRTERVRLGTNVTPLSRRRPWKLARETVSIDHLSNGRLILGVGLGDVNEPGFTQFGEEVDPKRRAGVLDEALEVLVGLWSGEPFSFSGEHYRVQEVTFLPRPVQSPRIPIWVGGAWPHKGPVRRAARWDGACLYKEPEGGEWSDMMPDDVRALQAAIEAQRGTADAGAPFDIAIGGRERRDDWDQERAHIRSLAEVGVTWWVEYVEPAELEPMLDSVKRGPLRID